MRLADAVACGEQKPHKHTDKSWADGSWADRVDSWDDRVKGSRLECFDDTST